MSTRISLRTFLRYPKSFFFLSFSFFVPVIALAYILLSEVNNSLRLVDEELQGLAYIERLRGPLQDLQQHRGMSVAFGGGDQSFRAMMEEKQSVIDQGFYALQRIHERPGTSIAMGGRIRDLEDMWRAIKARAVTMKAAESLDAHNLLISEIITLFGNIIDASGLILEPSPDGFYMVDLVGTQLPRLTELVGQVRALGAHVAATGNAPDEVRLKLELALDKISERSRHLAHDLHAVFSARDDMRTRLGSASEEASVSVARFSLLIRESILDTKHVAVGADTVFSAGTRAIDNVFSMYDQMLPALSGLLKTRQNDYRQQRLATVAVVIVICLILAYLLTTRNRLERLIEDRTNELKNINRELEAFSYSVSHDLRTPLRAINGFTEILQGELPRSLTEEAKHCLRRIVDSTLRMEQLIDGLLGLSHVIRKEILLEPVDLSAVARGIADRLQELSPERRVQFDIPTGVSTVGDAHLLRAALENLFNNAWKFTERQPDGRIEFGREMDPEGDKFFVRDNGAGFDMKFSHKLFAPFERLHDESEFVGNGIGLATVRRIVDRHGGRVWAVGTLGQGATFYFTVGTKKRASDRDRERS